jgi:hypothetical protein
MRKRRNTQAEGVQRTLSALILPVAVAAVGLGLWVICHTSDIAHTPYWPATAIIVAAGSASALRARWKFLLKAAYQEGTTDGYLRGVSERIKGTTPGPQ